MAILQLQYSVFRSLEYLIFFLPALLFAAYALLCATRAPGVRRELDNAIASISGHIPNITRRGWDVSLSLDSGFMQPVAIAEAELQECPFKKIRIRMHRRPGLLALSGGTCIFKIVAESPVPAKGEVLYQMPLHSEQKPIFVLKSRKGVDEVSLDPLCMDLNSEPGMMEKLGALSPSLLELSSGAASSSIRLEFQSQTPDISDAVSILCAMARVAIPGGG